MPGPAGTTKPRAAHPPIVSAAATAAANRTHTSARTRLLDLLLDCGPLDRSPVAVERPPPGGDGTGTIGHRKQQVADVILDHRVARQLFASLEEVDLGAVVGAALEVGPAERIEVGAVVGIE